MTHEHPDEWSEDKFPLEKKVESLEHKIESITGGIEEVKQLLESWEKEDAEYNEVDLIFNGINAKIKTLRDECHSISGSDVDADDYWTKYADTQIKLIELDELSDRLFADLMAAYKRRVHIEEKIENVMGKTDTIK